MERKKILKLPLNNILDNTELVEAFCEVAREEHEEVRRRRLHLKPDPVWLEEFRWKKGESGNPKGRPPAVKISSAAFQCLREIEPETGITYAELIAIALIREAINGNVSAAREILEITEGPIPKRLEISANVNFQIEGASDEELDQIIKTAFETMFGGNTNNNSTGGN